MVDWLHTFYHYIGSSRQVLLLMDNFSAYLITLEFVPLSTNIRIEFLPKNLITIFQLLNQGIIQNLKAYYQKRQLIFSIIYFNTNKDSVKEVTLENAVKQILHAQNFDVSPSTIQKCWKKSIITKDDTIVVDPKIEDFVLLFQ